MTIYWKTIKFWTKNSQSINELYEVWVGSVFFSALPIAVISLELTFILQLGSEPPGHINHHITSNTVPRLWISKPSKKNIIILNLVGNPWDRDRHYFTPTLAHCWAHSKIPKTQESGFLLLLVINLSNGQVPKIFIRQNPFVPFGFVRTHTE